MGRSTTPGHAGVGVVRDLNAARAAVAELVTRDAPDDALKGGGGGERLPESGPVDVQGVVVDNRPGGGCNP